MAGKSVITEAARKKIGVEWPPKVFEIEKGAIVKFAAAIGDSNLLWADPEGAKKSRYGSLIASPTFSCVMENTMGGANELIQDDIPLKRVLNGGNEWEYYDPIRPGDVIKVTSKIASMTEREGKTGLMLFTVFEHTFKNQHGKVVLKARSTAIRY